MSGLSGLSNHCRERSFLIWAAVGFFALAIGVSSALQWTHCACSRDSAAGSGIRGPSTSIPITDLLALRAILRGARQQLRYARGSPALTEDVPPVLRFAPGAF